MLIVQYQGGLNEKLFSPGVHAQAARLGDQFEQNFAQIRNFTFEILICKLRKGLHFHIT